MCAVMRMPVRMLRMNMRVYTTSTMTSNLLVGMMMGHCVTVTHRPGMGMSFNAFMSYFTFDTTFYRFSSPFITSESMITICQLLILLTKL